MKRNWLWDTRLKESEVRIILKIPHDIRYAIYSKRLLSRNANPKYVFEWITPSDFVQQWPNWRRSLKQDKSLGDRIVFWDSIYNCLSKTVCNTRVLLAHTIKRARKRQNMTQADLALKLGVNQKRISFIESGRDNLNLSTIDRLKQALNF